LKIVAIASVVAFVLASTGASAAKTAAVDPTATYPTKPVRLLMGPAAGGPTDSVGRVITMKLGETWSMPVVVENRPGAGNTMATAAAAKASPDGYTLLLCPSSEAVAPSLYAKLPYDFSKEIAAISHIGSTPNILVVHPSFPAKTVNEFIAHAKAHPGKINYGGVGIGQSGHLSMELLKSMTGIDIVYVPYKSAGLVMTDLLAGRMDAQSTNLPLHVDNVRTGKVRALGVTSAKRSPRLPDVPTIAETVPGFDVMVWYGVCAPAGLPKSIVYKIAADVAQVLKMPDVQRRLADYGVDVDFMGPEQIAAYIREQTARWGKVVKQAGIQGQ